MRRKDTTTEMMKDYITESLLLLLRSEPYQEISIKRITEKAGVNRSTYYRNFDSKEDIIRYYYSSLLMDFRDSVQSFSGMESYLLSMFSYFHSKKDSLLLLHRQHLSYLLLDALNDTFLDVEQKVGRDQISVYYHTGGIFNTFLFWFQKDMEITPSAMTSMALSFLPHDFYPLLI